MIMTKEIHIVASNVSAAKDRKFCFDTYEKILDSVMNASKIVFNLSFDKTKDSFTINFGCKVCQEGDWLWILIKEYLSCIFETESKVSILIDEIEQDGNGVTYRMHKYSPRIDAMI